MTPFKIIRVPILPLRMVNAHLIAGPKGCILVDTGLPRSERKVERALSAHGLAFKDIKLIVVTHAHVDHAGNAARLRELTGAPILGHEGDLPYYLRDTPMSFCPTSWAARFFLKTPLPHEEYAAFEPDILLRSDSVFDLDAYGIHGTIDHTAGHTPGSISLQLSSRDALVSDLLASGILIGGMARLGRAIRPPFEDDPHAVGLELLRLLDAGAERFYLGHGGPLTAREVRRHAQMLVSGGP